MAKMYNTVLYSTVNCSKYFKKYVDGSISGSNLIFS